MLRSFIKDTGAWCVAHELTHFMYFDLLDATGIPSDRIRINLFNSSTGTHIKWKEYASIITIRSALMIGQLINLHFHSLLCEFFSFCFSFNFVLLPAATVLLLDCCLTSLSNSIACSRFVKSVASRLGQWSYSQTHILFQMNMITDSLGSPGFIYQVGTDR